MILSWTLELTLFLRSLLAPPPFDPPSRVVMANGHQFPPLHVSQPTRWDELARIFEDKQGKGRLTSEEVAMQVNQAMEDAAEYQSAAMRDFFNHRLNSRLKVDGLAKRMDSEILPGPQIRSLGTVLRRGSEMNAETNAVARETAQQRRQEALKRKPGMHPHLACVTPPSSDPATFLRQRGGRTLNTQPASTTRAPPVPVVICKHTFDGMASNIEVRDALNIHRAWRVPLQEVQKSMYQRPSAVIET